jgi:hypothetical protein
VQARRRALPQGEGLGERTAGAFGLLRWSGVEKRILKMENERKYEKSLQLKEFTCTKSNIKMHTN